MTLIERVFSRARDKIRDKIQRDLPIDITPVFDRDVAQTPQIQDMIYAEEISRLREEEREIGGGFKDGWEAGRRQRKPGTTRKNVEDLYQ